MTLRDPRFLTGDYVFYEHRGWKNLRGIYLGARRVVERGCYQFLIFNGNRVVVTDIVPHKIYW